VQPVKNSVALLLLLAACNRPFDPQYVLNRGRLQTHVQAVVCSHESERNWLAGDQTRVYAMRVNPISVESFDPEIWRRGPLHDPSLRNALETAELFARQTTCATPALAELDSDRFFLSFPSVTLNDGRAENLEITAYDTREAMLYHYDVRW
jgi:hypothetical protein